MACQRAICVLTVVVKAHGCPPRTSSGHRYLRRSILNERHPTSGFQRRSYRRPTSKTISDQTSCPSSSSCRCLYATARSRHRAFPPPRVPATARSRHRAFDLNFLIPCKISSDFFHPSVVRRCLEPSADPTQSRIEQNARLPARSLCPIDSDCAPCWFSFSTSRS